MKENFYFVLKDSQTGLYFKDNNLLNIYYTDNIYSAMTFLSVGALKGFLLYLQDCYPDLNFTVSKVVLKEYNFICH